MGKLRSVDEIDLQDADRAVLEVRKTLKQARAALRLQRTTMGDPDYHDANQRLRDAGRPLTDLRDAAALVDTLKALRKSGDKGTSRSYISRMRRQLEREHAAKRDAFKAADLRASIATLNEVRSRIPSLTGGADTSSARAGVLKSYKKGRRAFAKVRRNSSTVKLHEWRKQAKYLANELDLAPNSLRNSLATLRRLAKRLAALLGEDHDLSVLRIKLRDIDDAREASDSLGRTNLNHRLRRGRRKRQKKALRLGHLLYGHSAATLNRKLDELLSR
jgi:CHAD domain-containing protein